MVAASGCGALAADHPHPVFPRVVEQDRHFAGRAVQVRLDHLKHEAGRYRRVEGVAALFQHGHAGGGRQPVGRGDGAEGALDFRTGCEHGERVPKIRLLNE